MTLGVLYCIVLLIYLVILNFILNLFKIQSPFHWFPVVLNIVAYIAAGLFFGAGGISYKDEHFVIKKSGNPVIYTYFLNPVGKTVPEVERILQAKHKENGYRKGHIIRILIFMGIGLAIVIAGYLIKPLLLASLVTYPVAVITGLVCSLTAAEESFIDDAVGTRWRECVCPHCKAICDPYVSQTSNFKSSDVLYTYTTTETDRYTDGYNTVYVEREQEHLGVKNISSWSSTYYCVRCKKSFTKHKHHTS